jgi:hypothetical protein
MGLCIQGSNIFAYFLIYLLIGGKVAGKLAPHKNYEILET